MHRLKLLGLTLTAVFALTAVASAPASAALPEFTPNAGYKFPITLKGNSVETAEVWLGNFRCYGIAFKGEITGAKAVSSLTTEAENCEYLGNHFKCQTEGATTGHLVIPGTGSLVYIAKATKLVGIVLTVPKLKFKCGTQFFVQGGVVIPVTPINTQTSQIGMNVERLSRTEQRYTTYENELGEMKEAFLEINEGSGYRKAALGVPEEIRLATSHPLTIKG
jgi:hypothetical protein